MAARSRLQAKLAAAKRALDRAIENLVHGRISEAEADAVLPALRAAYAAAELAVAEEAPKVVTLHPGAVEGYLHDLETLANALARDQSEGVRRRPTRYAGSSTR
jgi:hypothetical protein